MSEWRPDGWENPYEGEGHVTLYGHDASDLARIAFNAGTDLTLAKLKDSTDSVHTGRGSLTRLAEYVALRSNEGTLVFIPDEKV